jgi:ribosome maturation factor RimP
MRKIEQALHEQLEVLLNSMGYELVGCEVLPQGGQKTFRMYIDKEGGVTIDDCSKVSHQVGAMFDVDDPIEGRYSLEVSSPGVDRPLFAIRHYQKYIGQRVKIRLHTPINERRSYKGLLERVEGEDIYLVVDDIEQEVKLPFSVIERANLIGGK